MFKQPDAFAGADGRDLRLHRRHCVRIGHRPVGDAPFGVAHGRKPIAKARFANRESARLSRREAGLVGESKIRDSQADMAPARPKTTRALIIGVIAFAILPEERDLTPPGRSDNSAAWTLGRRDRLIARAIRSSAFPICIDTVTIGRYHG